MTQSGSKEWSYIIFLASACVLFVVLRCGFSELVAQCLHSIPNPFRFCEDSADMCWYGWQAYAAPEYVVWFSRLCHIFTLTSMSVSLYDIMGGSLKIRFSNGCCCIRYHFFVKVSLRFGAAGWYCVMKGKIRFFLFRFVGGGLVSFVQTSSERTLLIKFCG